MSEIGKRLKETRLRLKYSQKFVEEELKLNKSIISKYENGKESISLGIIVKLSKFYKVSERYLLNGEKEPIIRTSYKLKKVTNENDLLVIEWADTFIRDLYEAQQLLKQENRI